jgi:hypothetical protein
MPTSGFQAERISKASTITLRAPLETVFPLFGPIRERDWEAGWDPQVLYATDDLVEEHMVFKTRSHHMNEPDYIWTVSRYHPERAFIEYTVFTPDRLWWIAVQCQGGAQGDTTRAEITYTFTGLTEQGVAINRAMLERMYRHDLKDWEAAINHYLETGKRLEQGH